MAESDQQTDAEPTTPALQGRRVEFDAPKAAAEAIELAFDYRGDITVETRDGRTIAGYLFDRSREGDAPYVRLLTPEGQRERITYADMAALTFTGRDTAAGKSWETWVKKYEEKKAKGETATIEPEKLD